MKLVATSMLSMPASSSQDGSEPVGICGTGVVSLLSELLRAGAVSNRGRIEPGHPLVEDREGAREFLLAELPSDWRVTVDSHSSSPIFADENAQLIFQARKMGTVTDEYVIDNMPFPNKEMARLQLREKEAKNAQMMQQLLQADPEIGQKLLQKQVGLKR